MDKNQSSMGETGKMWQKYRRKKKSMVAMAKKRDEDEEEWHKEE